MFWRPRQHQPVDNSAADEELEQAFNSGHSDQPYDAPLPLEEPVHEPIPGAYDFEANPAEARVTSVADSDLSPPRPTPSTLGFDSLRHKLAQTLLGRGYGQVSQHDPHAGIGSNDGVFANLNAKPERAREDWVGGDDEDGNSKEMPPSYEAAASDTAPPYWETTVMAPTGFYGPDEILVEGLPIGNLFAFAWNMLVSCSFQFVGFLLTYLLHTTHAAKHGSRAGLGITLIQYSFYLRSRASLLASELDNDEIPPELVGILRNANETREGTDGFFWDRPMDGSDPALFADASASQSLGPAPTAISALSEDQREGLEEAMKMSSMANDWLAWMLMAIGWALLLGSIFVYYKAWRYARAIRAENDAANTEPEATTQVDTTAPPPTIAVIVA